MGKTIGIISLKGGVGKTSVVVALGAAIADFGKKVLLVDANFSAPNLALNLNISNPKTTIHDVLRDEARIENAIYEHEFFDVIPSSLLNRQIKNPFKLKEKINSLRDKYDIILIDSSPALNNETLAAMIASDELFVVTTPDYPTLGMTLRAIRLAKQKKTPINGLILNKVHNKKFELSLNELEETAEVPVLAVIPYDINILEALSKAVPSTVYKQKSKGSIEYKKLAAALIGEKYKPVSKFRSFFRKSPKKQEVNRMIFYKSMFE